MIYCPQCGTPNKPNSKFCKNCAASLQAQSEIRCPICDTPNPHDAASCKNCGTRLVASSAGTGAPKSSPADAPENITPFNPPELSLNNDAPAEKSSVPRPTFSRSNSEWLRRMGTPPTEAPSDSPAPENSAPEISATAAAASTAAASTNDISDWLQELQVETAAQANANELTQPAVAAKPQLSEIKLTGDDYDYSDIGGQVTDEMKAQLETEASGAQSVDDEVELMRRLLGLSAVEAVASAQQPEQPKAVAAETSPQALSETIPPVETVAAAAVETTASDEIVASPLTQAPETAVESLTEPITTESVAPLQAAATATAASAIAAQEQPTVATTEAVVAAKPQLSEIKLTGDDYDYSDIGGQVTDEMKAQLETEASGAQSVDDEVELMRRLLGLSAVEAVASAQQPEQPKAVAAEISAPAPSAPESIAAPMQGASSSELPQETIAQAAAEPVSEITEPPAARAVEISQFEESDNDLLVKLAAASSAAVAAKLIQDDKTKIESTAEQASAQMVEPPAAAPALAASELAVDEVPSAAPMLSGDNLPEWLREIAPPELTEADLAHSEAAHAQEADEFSGKAALGAAALAANLADLDESEREELPDWLREPIVPAAAVAGAETVELLEPAEAFSPELSKAEDEIAPELQPDLPIELPEWMRAGAPPPRETIEIVETTGPLAGVSGILPLALALTEPHTLSTPTPARGDGGRIFQSLLAQPLAGTAEAKPAVSRTRLVSTRHILYLLILGAALFALLLPAGADELGLLGKDVVNSPSAVFYDQLNALPQGSTVLLTFDYAPGQSPELDPAARVILENLAARQVNVIALSTNPNGATIAQTLLERARELQPKFTFVNLGYIPGNEAGLKRLALGWLPATFTDTNGVTWGQSPLAKNIRGMDDLALNILILGDNSILNAWMMQVQPIIKSPMVAATTAGIYPQARMFVDANQLRASLRGLTGAAELELWSGVAGRAVKSVNALSFVSLVLAGIIIVTNIVWLMRRKKK